MTIALPEENAPMAGRRWAWTAVAALLVAAAAGGIASWGGTARTPLLRAGRLLPAVPVSTADQQAGRLDEQVDGIADVLVAAPTCELCTEELLARVEEAERAGSPLQEMLLLVVRSDGIPRAAFMEGYRRGLDCGMRVLLIQPAQAREMGIARVPALIRLDPDGLVVSVSYRKGEPIIW